MPSRETALPNVLFRCGLGEGAIDSCPSPEIHHLYALHREAGYSMRVRQVGLPEDPLNVAIGAMRGQPLSLLGCWNKADVFLDQSDITYAIRSKAKDQHYNTCKQNLVKEYTFTYVLLVLGAFCLYVLFDTALGLNKLFWALPVVALALAICLPLGVAKADSVLNEKWAESDESKLLALL